ncbi:MAG: hypothetical protein V4726_11170 [Verrucomicrobiota bacterium]
MSAIASTLSAALSGTSYITVPAAGLAVVSTMPADALPDPVRAAVWILGGLAFLATVAKNLTQLAAVAKGLMGLPMEQRPGDRPELFVTRKELEACITRIEKKVDRNHETHRREMRDLTATMHTCLRDMSQGLARLEGAISHSG